MKGPLKRFINKLRPEDALINRITHVKLIVSVFVMLHPELQSHVKQLEESEREEHIRSNHINVS